MYDAHSKRMAMKRVSELRNAMIAGVWSNSNYDDEKNSRNKLLQNIDSFYDNAVNSIYGYKTEEEYITEMMEDSPFFAAMKRPVLEVNKESLEDLSE